jgi:hypothetical protein
MTASREQSNQGFELTGRRRFACEPSLLFAINRYPALHGRHATGSLALLREFALYACLSVAAASKDGALYRRPPCLLA